MRERKVAVISLGCPKNTVDTEQMLGQLLAEGFSPVREPAEAELLLLNTCCFIDQATEESLSAVEECASWRRENPRRRLVVAGCLPMRRGRELQRHYPEIDLLLGTRDFGRLGDLTRSLWDSGPRGARCFLEGDDPFPRTPRMRSDDSPTSYLKIAEGCDHRCTFCIVPLLRGNLASRPMDHIEEEGRALVETGVRELILVAQDTTAYGRDLEGKRLLPRLIRRLADIRDLKWIRVMYAHPSGVGEELREALSLGPPVCRYLDVPLQHVSPRVLRAMKRPADIGRIRDNLASLRHDLPELALRTTFLVGFPGEREEDFRMLLDFVEEGWFERAGAFLYSPQAEAASSGLPDQVDPHIARERYRELMEKQQAISRRMLERRVGSDMTVLISGGAEEDGFQLEGRTEFDAPEIDGRIYLRGGGADRGEFVRVRVTGSRTYDLEGEVVEASLPD